MLIPVRLKIEIPTHELHQKYNKEMGGVGIADNLRNYYMIYFGVWNRKWWW